MIALFVAFYLPLMIAYGDTFVWMWDRWMLGDYYSHGPLLPALAAAVIYTNRHEWAKIETRPNLHGWWFLGVGLVLRFCGAAQMVDSLSAFSLLFSLVGVVLLTLGFGRLKKVLPVILLIVFATPMPMDLTGKVAFELKEVAIDGALWVGNLVGLGASRAGASIHVPGQALALPVADACGGLRSLLALSTLGYCLAFFMGSTSPLRRVVILLATIPAAVLVNMARIVGLCFMAREFDVHYAGSEGHTIMNMAAWIANLGILLLLDSRLERRARRLARHHGAWTAQEAGS